VSPHDGERYDLFVSYAHVDDRDGWVTALVEALLVLHTRVKYRGWTVFFDTKAIQTADDWEERIGGGLRSAGVMLALLSPAYFKSEWCRREWHEFCQQEKRRGRPNRLFPVYLETDPDLERKGKDESRRDDWREDLRRRQFLDLRCHRGAPREDPELGGRLKELERHLHDRLLELSLRAARPGVPSQSIPLPCHFVARREELGTLKAEVLDRDDGPGVVVNAVFGLGGVGKSTLAGALVQDPEVRLGLTTAPPTGSTTCCMTVPAAYSPRRANRGAWRVP
jgi:hypothetical protein